MTDKVKRIIDEYNMLEKGEGVVIGVSGGADSVALLEILYQLSSEYELSLYVVHVNHGIRAEAGDDADYVKRLCDEKKIPFYLFEEDIPSMARNEKMTEEEMGRAYRYRCFAEVCGEVGVRKLAVAHHMDDQVETVMFHLARGTDVTGAAGMRPISSVRLQCRAGNEAGEDLVVIRPLLAVEKREITAWLNDRNISWQEDITNSNNDYARNRIRNIIVPELSYINEQASRHIAEFAVRASKYDEYILKQARDYIDRTNMSDDGTGFRVNRENLRGQERILADRILYEMLTMAAGAKKDITAEHIDLIYDLLEKQSGKKIDLPYGVTARISYDWLIIERRNVDDNGLENMVEGREDISVNLSQLMTDKEMVIFFDRLYLYEGKYGFVNGDADNWSIMKEYSGLQGSIILRIYPKDKLSHEELKNFQKNYTKYFDCDKIENTLHIRRSKTEDYIVVDRYGHKKKLGKLFKDEKVPADVRGEQIVIAAGDEILMVAGGRRCESYKVESDTKNILEVRYEGESYGLSH